MINFVTIHPLQTNSLSTHGHLIAAPQHDSDNRIQHPQDAALETAS
jgi:hypothetical protein